MLLSSDSRLALSWLDPTAVAKSLGRLAIAESRCSRHRPVPVAHELQPQQPVHHQQEPEDQPRPERLRQPVPREDERRVDGDDGPHPVCGRRRGV